MRWLPDAAQQPQTEVLAGAAAVCSAPGMTLSCSGLGSCVAVALLDPPAGVAGLAHIMLPAAPDGELSDPGHYADRAVPALLEAVLAAGATHDRLEAVIAGGATLFPPASSSSLGERNAAAVRQALAACAITISGHATGGVRGRTIRVTTGPAMRVVVRTAGGSDEQLHGPPGDAAGDIDDLTARARR